MPLFYLCETLYKEIVRPFEMFNTVPEMVVLPYEYMYLRMNVCMFVHVCVCLSVCTYVCLSVRPFVCTRACM